MNNRISTVRKQFGLTQEEFGKRLNLSRNYVWMLERGEREPSERTFKDICGKFDINEPWLRTGEGEMFKELSKEQELTEFFADVLKEDASDFKRRLISVLSRLEVEEWELLESMAMRLAEEGKKETSGQ